MGCRYGSWRYNWIRNEQARDLGPRLAYQLLPIKNKVNNDWQYGLLVPGTAPFIGAVCAAFFVRYYLGYFI